MKNIVYIGNNLEANNPTTIVQLSLLLKSLGFKVVNYSSKKNKLLRLFDMFFGVLKHKNADFLLIDTYSTINFYFALIISQLARFLNLKYIPILHGGNLPFRLKNNPFLSSLIFKNAEINIAPSKYLLDNFQKNGFKTQFIPNVINIKNYNFKFRNKLKPKLLWVRAFDEIYNPIMAINVLILLKKTYPNAQLCMVGPDKDGSLNQVKLLVKRFKIEENIEFTGYLDKASWIQKSENFDIFINTTNIDNTPISVLEAMALGLPVISTNVGGISYLIENDKDGVLVEKNNEVEMTNAIIDLIKNPEKASKLVTSARYKVNSFDSSIVAEEWKKLLLNA